MHPSSMGCSDVSKCLPCDYITWASLRASYGHFSFSMGLTLSEQEEHLEVKGPKRVSPAIQRAMVAVVAEESVDCPQKSRSRNTY